MKWLYLILAAALLALAVINLLGVTGTLFGLWVSDAQTVRSSAAWALALFALSAAGFLRCWFLARAASRRGFPLHTHDRNIPPHAGS
jgi:hypothetical protein